MSHIPVHPAQKERFKLNIHGHLHEHNVMHHDDDRGPGGDVEDEFYYSVSCEQVDYTPKLISAIMKERLNND